MKKVLVTITAIAAATTLAAGLCACSVGDGALRGNKFSEFDTVESVYGFSSASAGMIISSMNSAKSAAAGVLTSAAETTEADTAALDGYMTLVESLLSDGKFSVESPESDRAEYTDKTVVSYPDLDGNATQYVMYYNKTLYKSETDDDGETEEKYKISGVMVIDGADYAIEGKSKSETDIDEQENKTELRVTLDGDSYMLVEHEVEYEQNEYEHSYEYSVYSGGALVEKSSFSYETENDETELKMKSFKNGATEVFKFEKERKNGNDLIIVKVGDGEAKQSYIVKITVSDDGGKTYEYIPKD